MDSETFYGVTLSEKEPLAQFEVSESDDVVDQKLIIKQICLGAEAKEKEFNVVQAEIKMGEKETLKIPIAVLKAGETRVLRPNVEFPSASVTFKLLQGHGPVYICGQHVVQCIETEEYEHDIDDEEVDDDEGNFLPPQVNGKNSNKKK